MIVPPTIIYQDMASGQIRSTLPERAWQIHFQQNLVIISVYIYIYIYLYICILLYNSPEGNGIITVGIP